ncbi:MAG: polyprenol monophosphomannose synthase [Caldilineaceae bacterium]|nr:polyprenol monophosphomannose synthase [Caldilineaceae bacterium]
MTTSVPESDVSSDEQQQIPIDQPLVCTVLPTYNERENIEPLIRGVLTHAITPHFVLVVDDNSPDGTAAVVEAVAAELNQSDAHKVVLLRRVGEKGLTSAIQAGIDEAIEIYHADIVTWMDCDLSMPPAEIPKLVRLITEGNADVAVGSRWIPGGADVAHGQMARTLSWLINRFAMLLLGDQIHDYTSGFIAAKAKVLRQIRLRGDYGEYCIDLLGVAQRVGFQVQEAPYICVPRTAGDSKTGANLWDYLVKGRKYVATVWRLR